VSGPRRPIQTWSRLSCAGSATGTHELSACSQHMLAGALSGPNKHRRAIKAQRDTGCTEDGAGARLSRPRCDEAPLSDATLPALGSFHVHVYAHGLGTAKVVLLVSKRLTSLARRQPAITTIRAVVPLAALIAGACVLLARDGSQPNPSARARERTILRGLAAHWQRVESMAGAMTVETYHSPREVELEPSSVARSDLRENRRTFNGRWADNGFIYFDWLFDSDRWRLRAKRIVNSGFLEAGVVAGYGAAQGDEENTFHTLWNAPAEAEYCDGESVIQIDLDEGRARVTLADQATRHASLRAAIEELLLLSRGGMPAHQWLERHVRQSSVSRSPEEIAGSQTYCWSWQVDNEYYQGLARYWIVPKRGFSLGKVDDFCIRRGANRQGYRYVAEVKRFTQVSPDVWLPAHIVFTRYRYRDESQHNWQYTQAVTLQKCVLSPNVASEPFRPDLPLALYVADPNRMLDSSEPPGYVVGSLDVLRERFRSRPPPTPDPTLDRPLSGDELQSLRD